MGAVNANKRITFVKNVILPGEKNTSFSFFSPGAASVFVSHMPLCPNPCDLPNFRLWGCSGCGSWPQEQGGQ